MADQAVVDLPDEYTEEWGDQFTLKAYKEAARHASQIAFDISAELSGKKQPVHKKLLHDAGMMLATAQLAARGAFEAIKEQGRTEAEILEEIVYGETGYPRQDDGEAPQLLLAELVVKREAVSALWEKVDEAYKLAGEGDRDNTAADQLREDASGAEGELRTYALNLIADGRPFAAKIAAAVLGRNAVKLEGLPALPGGSDAEVAA